MTENIASVNRYNAKEEILFSQSLIGYWVTKSSVSIFCRLSAIALLVISSITSNISVNVEYYSQFFLLMHGFVVSYSMIVFSIYLCVSIFLTIKHARALCSYSPFTGWACANFVGRLCVKVIGAATIGVGIVQIDWACEKGGIKPLFMWAYYPGLRRLAGHITPELASQSSKDLSYVSDKIPFSKGIHYLQNKTDATELQLAIEYKTQQENKIK